MTYDTHTLEVLHQLTPEGEDNYHKMLEKKADEILFKHEHPVKWTIAKIKDFFAQK